MISSNLDVAGASISEACANASGDVSDTTVASAAKARYLFCSLNFFIFKKTLVAIFNLLSSDGSIYISAGSSSSLTFSVF